ncbi:MAG: hypothetical protein WBM08_12085 [Prochlorococcaceae cyanobacterium]
MSTTNRRCANNEGVDHVMVKAHPVGTAEAPQKPSQKPALKP